MRVGDVFSETYLNKTGLVRKQGEYLCLYSEKERAEVLNYGRYQKATWYRLKTNFQKLGGLWKLVGSSRGCWSEKDL